MKILFQSQDVIAVHKPSGWLSVPSIQGRKDPRPVVGLSLRARMGPVYPVHRLDFEVEGILLFALHSKAQKTLHRIWDEKSVQKVYFAKTSLQSFSHWPEKVVGLVRDQITPGESGLWESTIVQGKRRSFVAEHGQKSLTQYELQQCREQGCLWRLSPLTGRRHQLRLELSRHGFPIWGDRLYGSSVEYGVNRIGLVAAEIHFEQNYNLDLPKFIRIDWDQVL